MDLVIEPATPFDRSLLWELHHAYFANRGIDAWREGEIPFFSTSNGAYAAQHARLFAAHVRDLEAAGLLAHDSPVVVMECAGGVGVFAANFLVAVEDLDPRLAARLVYVFSDYVEKSVREAVAAAPLARWMRAGKVIPARYDVTRPSELELLDGAVLPARPVLIICNYLCCVLPMKHLSLRQDDGWMELMVTIGGIGDDVEATDRESFIAAIQRNPTRGGLMEQVDVLWEWEPVSLEQALPDPRHQRAITQSVESLVEATVGWPVRYFDFLAAADTLLAEGGAVLTSDFGSNDRTRLRGRTTGRPQLYGNTLNQPVNTHLFTAWAIEAGLEMLKTAQDLNSLNSILTSRRAFGPEVQARFPELYLRLGAGDDVLDYWASAVLFVERKEHLRALRFLLRCAELDRHNPEHRYRLGELAIELNQPERAVSHLLIGYDIDIDRRWDFDFQLGRAYALMAEYSASITWYEKSAERAPHPVTWTNLGVILTHENRLADAYHAFQQALRLDPRYIVAEQRMQGLKDAVWLEALKDFELRSRSRSGG